MTADLAAWLLADEGPIAAQEVEARRLLRIAQDTSLELKEPTLLGRRIPGWHSWPDVERLCQQALAECAAKRRTVAHHAKGPSVRHPGYDCSWCAFPWPCFDLMNIAQAYADRPGWLERWTLR